MATAECRIEYTDQEVVKLDDVVAFLKLNTDVTHLIMVHSETTSGTINPIQSILPAAKTVIPDLVTIVDTISSFGAYEVNMNAFAIDYMIGSANKNI
jgi:2-aminoethylphosphonate-pyruvate transaminase